MGIFTHRFCSCCIGLLLANLGASGIAQEQAGAIPPPPSAKLPAPPAKTVLAWLGSGDPRLVAWGAYYAGQSKDPAAIAPMLELVTGWVEAENQSDPDGNLRVDAMTDVLDALIQRNVTVPTEGVSAIAGKFPVQAAILAARVPAAERLPLLQAWYDARNDGPRYLLARVAAMSLSKSPPPGFAASVLAETADRYSVQVVDGGEGWGGGSAGCCGAALVRRAPDWPPIYYYGLRENAPNSAAPLLIEAGGDRITYHRDLEPNGCPGPRALDDLTRQHLLLEMLHGDRSALRWKVSQNPELEWAGPTNFQVDLGRMIDTEEGKLRATVEALSDKGLLSDEEALSVRPKLLVTVIDRRQNSEPSLPRVESHDPHTTITF
jgi:hypothetical protein